MNNPDWIKPGAWCHCLGEGLEIFTIHQTFEHGATLTTKTGHAHGLESYTKLYQTMEELEERRPELKGPQ